MTAFLPLALVLVTALGGEVAAPVASAAPVAEGAPAGGVAAPGEASPTEAPAALIRRCLAAYGGERARVRFGRVRAEGAVTSDLHPGEVGRFSRTFDRSGRLRLEVHFPKGAPDVRVLDGARAFRYGEPAPAAVAVALRFQAARLDLPALLAQWEARVEDRGAVVHEGTRLRVLALETVPGLTIEAGIDPVSGRIHYVRGSARVGPRQVELFTVYRDYRVVDGALVAFREEGWANGEPTGDVVLEKVTFLDEVPEAAFSP